jgi:SAM-dependent methyltransferase
MYYQANLFGINIAEISSGIGSGISGAYPQHVTGFEINPLAVNYCKSKRFTVHQADENKTYPAREGVYDVCVLDNVLEHIAEPNFVLQECVRITHNKGGLVVAVPREKGYRSDPDHKVFYSEKALQNLHSKWHLINLFSMPFAVRSELLSALIPQYCLVEVYQKQIT